MFPVAFKYLGLIAQINVPIATIIIDDNEVLAKVVMALYQKEIVTTAAPKPAAENGRLECSAQDVDHTIDTLLELR